MQITTENMAKFEGGVALITNSSKGYFYRGQIKSVVVEGITMLVSFDWLIMNDGGANIPSSTWVKIDNSDHKVPLRIFMASKGDGVDICFYSGLKDEQVIMYTPEAKLEEIDPKYIREF